MNPFNKLPCYIAQPYGMRVYLCTDKKRFNRCRNYVMKDSADDLDNTAGALAYYESNKGMLLILGWFNGKQSTLTHECSHAIWKIMGAIGYTPFPDNNEPFAYLLGHMVGFFSGESES